MKIACISASQVPSATANSIQGMKACQALAQNGHQVRLLLPETGPGAPPAWAALAAHYGLEAPVPQGEAPVSQGEASVPQGEVPFEVQWIPAAPAWRRYDLAWKAVRRARAWGAELVYTWMLQAAVLALRQGLPAVLEVHDRITGRVGPWLFREFLRSRGRKRLLVITQALRLRLEADFSVHFPEDEVVIAPNGADLERYADLPDPSAARRALGLPECTTVAYSGHFYAGRGADLLYELARAFPQVSFLWVGGRPPDVAAWRARLAAEGLGNVHLTGFVENRRLPLYQAAAEILLMPYERAIAGSSGGNSAEICSPMKMFDYMAAGRAILSSDLPVLHEVLNPRNAVFCPPEDLPAWQQALGELLADPARRGALGSQARRDVEAYTWRARAARALAGFGGAYAG